VVTLASLALPPRLGLDTLDKVWPSHRRISVLSISFFDVGAQPATQA